MTKEIKETKNKKYYCPKCGKEATGKVSNNDYFKACNNCDEDFYEFELIINNLITTN